MELLTLIQSRFDEVGEAVQTWTLQKNKVFKYSVCLNLSSNNLEMPPTA
jgi:hypothetical protein